MPNTTSSLPEPETLQRLVNEVLAGNDVILFFRSDAGQALLDAAASHLSTLRSRALRVAGVSPNGLTLPALMAQVTGQPDPGSRNDEFLKQGFQALTVPDATCDRIVLLISDANTLQPGALRYIQFACRASTKLQLVFAGKRGFLEMVGPSEFIELRDRLAVAPILTPPSAEPRVPKPAVARQSTIAQQPVAARPIVVKPTMTEPMAAFAIPEVQPRPKPVRNTSAAPVPEQVRRVPAAVISTDLSRLHRGGMSSQRRRLAALTGVGLVIAASVTLGAWNRWIGEKPESRQQVMLTDALPTAPAPQAPETPAAPIVAPPTNDAASSPALAPAPVLPEMPLPLPPAKPDEASSPEPAPPAAAAATPAPSLLSVPSLKPPTSAARRVAPAQPRLAARSPMLHPGGVAAWGDPYPPPPSPESRPSPPPPVLPFQPDQTAAPRQSYIGTYSIDANGVRAFRLNP